ncbi:MAG: M23 family metallopeptidase [Oscillospiraceae bacterium]|jgi:murein DD-endopeptidase MepM/ murein hydrolase activator NlpD|nr:M23 family metallopeptidase [Oscillospiraceae bacterium]
MDDYAAHRAYSHAPRRRRHSGGSVSGGPRRHSRALACLAVLAFAVVIHYVFPHFSKAVGDKVTAFVDYRAAFAVIGEGLSGERKFTQALGDAWSIAFRTDRAEAVDAAAHLDAPKPTVPIVSPEETVPTGIPPEVTAPPDGENLAKSALEAFAESQYNYADYMIPAGVTYGTPTIEIAYRSPTDGIVSSGFGYRRHPVSGDVRFHYGTDIAAAEGSPVYAFADGVVTLTGESVTLGNYIIISHGSEITTTYAHCGEVFFAPDAAVSAGDKIASVSHTGNATGDCLHFELKIGGLYVNPEFYVQWA